MRTLHRIELLEQIYSDPFLYIGQKSFNLLYCFMLGNFEKKIKISSKVERELKKMPSFRKFVELKTSKKLTSSLDWSWALGFISENESDLFLKYFELVFEYEHNYPVDSTQIFETEISYENFYFIENIKAISERAEMFSIRGIPSIRAYLDGAIYLKKCNEVAFNENEQKIINVINSYKSKINPNLKFETWDRVLLRKKMNINEFTVGNYPNSWAMDRFFEILEEESNLKLKTWIDIKNDS